MRDDHGEMPATTPFFLSDVACTKPLYPQHLIVHSSQKETHLHSFIVSWHISFGTLMVPLRQALSHLIQGRHCRQWPLGRF